MNPSTIAVLLPDLGGGGAQKVMLSIAGALDRSRFEPVILVAGGSDAFAHHVPAGVAIENGRARRLRDGLPWLLRRVRATRPAVCLSVMGYLNLMLLGSRGLLPGGTRIVIREANTVASTVGALPRYLPAEMLYRALYPRADAIVSPTRVIADEIARAAPHAAGRIRVIPNPVDTAALRARAAIPRRDEGRGLRLVSAGRLTRQKGYDRLLGLMPLLPADTRLMVLGEGEERAALESQAQALGLEDRVTFAGFSHDVPAWIAGADAFVLPSRWEGLPNVVLESLALGTPAVVSDEAAVGELAAAVAPGALTIRPVDRSFAEAIAALPGTGQANAGLRQSLLPPAYEKCASVRAWEDLLESVMAAGLRGMSGERL